MRERGDQAQTAIQTPSSALSSLSAQLRVHLGPCCSLSSKVRHTTGLRDQTLLVCATLAMVLGAEGCTITVHPTLIRWLAGWATINVETLSFALLILRNLPAVLFSYCSTNNWRLSPPPLHSNSSPTLSHSINLPSHGYLPPSGCLSLYPSRSIFHCREPKDDPKTCGCSAPTFFAVLMAF
ncbi:hypothetical protein B0O80DRAFT_67164 [Mortierella sp. GBAus27b]|nr:hypothetical protein B0O80DRAFT_67164 [Mortierella sp. GBAus27b]